MSRALDSLSGAGMTRQLTLAKKAAEPYKADAATYDRSLAIVLSNVDPRSIHICAAETVAAKFVSCQVRSEVPQFREMMTPFRVLEVAISQQYWAESP